MTTREASFPRHDVLARSQNTSTRGYALYAFNHAEAIRAFRQAAALDPHVRCALGRGLALGPNINAPITEEAAKDAFQAIGQAAARRARL